MIQAQTIITKTIETVRQTFITRLLAGYIIGSLARGGFSEHESDVDLVFILSGGLTESDQAAFQSIAKQLSMLNVPFAKKLSLFWQSIHNLNEMPRTNHYAHLSSFEQVDLFQHGKLMYGVDVRTHGFRLPSQLSLEIDAVHTALEKLNNPKVMAILENPHLLFSQQLVAPTKLILFPIRLIYTALTHKIGSNKEAVNYYAQHYNDTTVHLVEAAFKWRHELPEIQQIDLELIRKNLPIIYHRLITIYREKMQNALKKDLVQSLSQWDHHLQKALMSKESSIYLHRQGITPA